MTGNVEIPAHKGKIPAKLAEKQRSSVGLGRSEARDAPSSSSIAVALRLRPLSSQEAAVNALPAWVVDDEGHVRLAAVGAGPAYAFDAVHRPEQSNKDVYNSVASPVVRAAAQGINGTIFAYGVTSSGKTHTMLGGAGQQGLVQLALQELFQRVARAHDRCFLIHFSMLEIYNEIINDLLEPSATQLRLRENAGDGAAFVEGLTRLEVRTAEDAIRLVACGNKQRKVSATQFNEGSSRSHTICRVAVESCSAATGDDRAIAHFNLIDLAGSESARAVADSGRRREGAFINKSLLTLGAVISKLAEGGALHIPFRDSKLTRLLRASLTGPGARVAVVCCITPAAAQAEETHNTLKFATCASAVKIAAVRNRVRDEHSQLLAHQQQIRELRAQLARVQAEAVPSTAPADIDAMQRSVQRLRSELDEQRAATEARASEKAALEAKLSRLHAVVLKSSRALLAAPTPRPHSARAANDSAPLLQSRPQSALHEAAARDAVVQRSFSAAPGTAPCVHTSRVPPLTHSALRTASFSASTAGVHEAAWPMRGDSGAVLATGPRHSASGELRSELHATPRLTGALHMVPQSAAGELHTGPAGALSLYEYESPYIAENATLRRHLAYLLEELDKQGTVSTSGESVSAMARGLHSGASTAASAAQHNVQSSGGPLHTAAASARNANEQGARPLPVAELATAPPAHAHSASPLHHQTLAASSQHASVTVHNSGHRVFHSGAIDSNSGGSLQPRPLSARSANKPPMSPALPLWTSLTLPHPHHPEAASASTEVSTGDSAALAARLERTEARLAAAQARLQAKEAARAAAHRTLARFRALGERMDAQLRAVTEDNSRLRGQLSVNDQRVEHLRGYNLDALPQAELDALSATLQGAADRVRITSTLRGLQHGSSGSAGSSAHDAGTAQRPQACIASGGARATAQATSDSVLAAHGRLADLPDCESRRAGSAQPLGQAALSAGSAAYSTAQPSASQSIYERPPGHRHRRGSAKRLEAQQSKLGAVGPARNAAQRPAGDSARSLVAQHDSAPRGAETTPRLQVAGEADTDGGTGAMSTAAEVDSAENSCVQWGDWPPPAAIHGMASSENAGTPALTAAAVPRLGSRLDREKAAPGLQDSGHVARTTFARGALQTMDMQLQTAQSLDLDRELSDDEGAIEE